MLVEHLDKKINILCNLKNLRSSIGCSTQHKANKYDVVLVVFEDPSIVTDRRQFNTLCSLSIGNLEKNAESGLLFKVLHKLK